MRLFFFSIIFLSMSLPKSIATPGDWGAQTWTDIDTRYPIYRKDVVYGSTPFLIDDSRDGNLKNSIGIFRESSGLWATRDLTRLYYGMTSDIPVTR